VFSLPNEGPNEVHTKFVIFREEVRFLGPVYLGNSNKNVAAILNNSSKRSKSRKKSTNKWPQNSSKDIIVVDVGFVRRVPQKTWGLIGYILKIK
jgi:hypothetical protein